MSDLFGGAQGESFLIVILWGILCGFYELFMGYFMSCFVCCFVCYFVCYFILIIYLLAEQVYTVVFPIRGTHISTNIIYYTANIYIRLRSFP